jgi:hypothetical protein
MLAALKLSLDGFQLRNHALFRSDPSDKANILYHSRFFDVMPQGCHARFIDPYGGPIGPRLLGDPACSQTFRVAYDSGDHVHPSDAGYDNGASRRSYFFQSNEVEHDEQAHLLWQAPDSKSLKGKQGRRALPCVSPRTLDRCSVSV